MEPDLKEFLLKRKADMDDIYYNKTFFKMYENLSLQKHNLLLKLGRHYNNDLQTIYNEVKDLQTQHNNNIVKDLPDNFFYTFNPRPDVSFDDFYKGILRIIKKKHITDGIWVIEQRGTSLEDIGKGFHFHMLFKRGKKGLYEWKKELKSSISSLIGEADETKEGYNEIIERYSCLKIIKDEDLEKTKNYLLGSKSVKKDKTKSAKQEWDKIFREDRDLKSYYILGNGI